MVRYRNPGTQVFEDSEHESVNTDNGRIGTGASRQLTNNDWVTVNVPNDYATITDAANDVGPLLTRHPVRVEVEPGTYDEDVVIRPGIRQQVNEDLSGETHPFVIAGQGADHTDTVVNSVWAEGVGAAPTVRCYRIGANAANPYDNEDAAFAAYGCNELELMECGLVDAGNFIDKAMHAYGSGLSVSGFDLGADIARRAIWTKHNGSAYVQPGTDVTGSVTEEVIRNGSPLPITLPDISATGGTAFVGDLKSGMVINYETGETWFPNRSAGEVIIKDQVNFDGIVLKNPDTVSPTNDPTTQAPDTMITWEIDGSVYEVPAYTR
jgi:hypothetical protein